ncbi:MAG: hypothetical protein SPE19_02660 [Candidatus Faecousia sp.]|nr:hypothetical protein [Candidatus Faecousia sp.]
MEIIKTFFITYIPPGASTTQIQYPYCTPSHSQSQHKKKKAYIPGKQNEYEDYSDTMVPEGKESVHPRYAISWRNNWMLRQPDYVVTYITHSWGGAAQYAAKAARQGKNVINLAGLENDALEK